MEKVVHEKYTYYVPVSGSICVEAKDAYAALKIARNWSHKIKMEAEGGETYDYDLSKVHLLHIETDQNHTISIDWYFDDEKSKAKSYWKSKIVPFLPKKLRDQINGGQDNMG